MSRRTQYVAGDLVAPPAVVGREVTELTASDVPDMVQLAAETEPGPFGPNSHRTGRWFGIRRGGRLVAMAGERMRVDGFGEVSGVCVDPSVRGEGLGAVVTLAASHGIRERGDTPMLHVRDGNDGAHRLYRRIGFETRRQVVVARAALGRRVTRVPHRGPTPRRGWRTARSVGRWVRAHWEPPPSLPRRGLNRPPLVAELLLHRLNPDEA